LWLTVYLISWITRKCISLANRPENMLDQQPASIQQLEPLHFSGRRSALVFISMLPFSTNAGRWGWWDVYMPDNDRRRAYQRELESSPQFREAIGWQNRPSCGSSMEGPKRGPLVSSDRFLIEAVDVMRSFPCARHLGSYLDAVCPEKDVLSTIVLY